MKTIVIYHRADFDGIFCREIAKKFLPDAEFIGWDYGDPTPLMPPEQCRLYILDLSVPEMMAYPGLIWIDHHKSAIEKYSPAIKGYRIDGVAACRLAWQWFTWVLRTPDSGGLPDLLPDKEAFVERRVIEPLAVRLAGEYDIWDKRDPRAELFQHGLRSMDLDGLWKFLLSEPIKATVAELEAMIQRGENPKLNPDGTVDVSGVITEMLLRKGESIQYAQKRQNESIIKEIGFTFQWEGLTFLACNHARYNSLLFTAGLTPEHDACFGFKWTGKEWTVSLYHAPGKEHHDLSLIAVKHGGGGHRGACGFRTARLPFMEAA